MNQKRRLEDSSDDESENINRISAKMMRRANNKRRLFNDTNDTIQNDDCGDSVGSNSLI